MKEHVFHFRRSLRWIILLRLISWCLFIFLLTAPELKIDGAPKTWVGALTVFFLVAIVYDGCRWMVRNKPQISIEKGGLSVRTCLNLREREIHYRDILSIGFAKRMNNTLLISLRYRPYGKRFTRFHAIFAGDYDRQDLLESMMRDLKDQIENSRINELDSVSGASHL